MKHTIAPGATATFSYTVPANKTVPHLYPEAAVFQSMPAVFATGFMVGLIEWTCMKALEPHLEAGEGSVGVHVDMSHSAATLPGQTITVVAEVTKVDGRRVSFKVKAHDGVEAIGAGAHDRFVVPWDKFAARINAKAKTAGVAPLSEART
jgi:fluoroacetyl-CoA thioesterase